MPEAPPIKEWTTLVDLKNRVRRFRTEDESLLPPIGELSQVLRLCKVVRHEQAGEFWLCHHEQIDPSELK